MDPIANIEEQVRIATRMVNGRVRGAEAERLAELVLALHEWRKAGGFDPYTAEG